MKFRFIFTSICFILCLQKTYGQQLTVKKTDQGIEVSDGGEKALFYQKLTKSFNGQYQRAGYVHPLYGLNGEILTEDFPKDHLYHHGIFLAWHQIIYKGENIANSWISENISWDVKQIKTKEKGNRVVLYPNVLWNSKINQEPLSLINENTKITIYRSNDQYRIIDFEIHLKPLVNELQIGGANDNKGYGGFCLRFKAPQSLTFFSQGKKIAPEENAVTAGPWMDFVGSFGNSTKSGVAVLNHPSNPGNTSQWILRNSTSMQNPVYPGRTPVEIPKKGTLLKYRLIIHNGDLQQEKLESLYREYIKMKKA